MYYTHLYGEINKSTILLYMVFVNTVYMHDKGEKVMFAPFRLCLSWKHYHKAVFLLQKNVRAHHSFLTF